MTDYDELGKRLVACKGFRWMPGMLVSNGARIVTVNEDTPLRFAGFYPDLSDAATKGCVMQLVREAWDDLDLFAVVMYDGRWSVRNPRSRVAYGQWGIAEADAMVAALEAAP